MIRIRIAIAATVIAAGSAVSAWAVVVDYTGGTVVRLDATTETTNNLVVWDNVDYYDENGFRLDFLPNSGSAGFATHVGNYYGAQQSLSNDVIHSHWALGDFGQVAVVTLTKIGGGTFDFNYFILTSNTEKGGNPATGNEIAFVQGLNSNLPTGPPVLLPSEDWGFPATQIYLPSWFDAVDEVQVFVGNKVDCFGMDEFYIDEDAPPPIVPEPASVGLLLAAAACVSLCRRRPN